MSILRGPTAADCVAYTVLELGVTCPRSVAVCMPRHGRETRLVTYVCQNKKCVGNNGRPSEQGTYFNWGPRGEFCCEDCMAETLNVPTQREHELQAALHQ